MKNSSKSLFFLVIILVFSLYACQEENQVFDNPEEFINALPQNVQYPIDNPYSREKEELGRLLYWDPILSGSKDVACVTCHHPNFGYADGLNVSQGVDGIGLGPNRLGGQATVRNAPTVLNTAFNGMDIMGDYQPENAPMFWDNRANSLEAQALLPILSKEEMRGSSITEETIVDTIINRLKSIPEYLEKFEKAYNSPGINQKRILDAIATFERSIIANNSRFDQYMRGDLNAMTEFEIAGMNKFIEVGCAECHSGPMFSDYELHTIGIMENGSGVDRGATNNFDFRTPTLRNLNHTAPYMHNGLHNTLQEVMEFYESIAEGSTAQLNENLALNDIDEEMLESGLDENEIDEILAFLETLNDDNFDKTIPESVPSGLSVGGNIE